MYEPNSPIVEAKLKIVTEEFRRDSKGNIAARQIVQWREELSKEDIIILSEEIPIKAKTLEGVFTRLRKLKLYPPQEFSFPSSPEEPQEASHPVSEVLQPSLEYVTREDFETLKKSTNEYLENLNNSINNLASLMNRDLPLNPGEDEEEEEYEDEDEMPMQGEMIQPGERIQPGEMMVQEGSSTRESVDIKPKTRMYFDLARQGAFHNYPGTREPGPFADFNGNISDFFNVLADEFFIRNYNADIGLTAVIPIK